MFAWLSPSLPRTRRSLWPLWALAAALLLKAAVPMLASAAAHAQGKTLVEVCTVYGVATIALDGTDTSVADPGQAPAHAPAHGSEHCALGGLLTGAALDAPPAPVVLHAPARATPVLLADGPPQAPDACAHWIARLKHGPPGSA